MADRNQGCFFKMDFLRSEARAKLFEDPADKLQQFRGHLAFKFTNHHITPETQNWRTEVSLDTLGINLQIVHQSEKKHSH